MRITCFVNMRTEKSFQKGKNTGFYPWLRLAFLWTSFFKIFWSKKNVQSNQSVQKSPEMFEISNNVVIVLENSLKWPK